MRLTANKPQDPLNIFIHEKKWSFFFHEPKLNKSYHTTCKTKEINLKNLI